MSTATISQGALPSTPSRLSDLVGLTKPRLSGLVIFTGGGSLLLAPQNVSVGHAVASVAGLVGVVAAANTLNNYLEQETDALMARTASRPLPTHRMAPSVALAQGLVLTALSVPLLTFGANPLTGLLGAIALVIYAFIYTPMKRQTALATLVGAIPGAMPPLMGWTAASGRLEAGGLLLFALLFLWQIPHFLAIGLYRAAEYQAAGMVIHANSLGPVATRRRIAAWTVLLVAATGLLVPLGVGGWLTGAGAALLGLGFLARALAGLRPGADDVWARGLFRYSLVYLTGLFGVLAVDHLLG